MLAKILLCGLLLALFNFNERAQAGQVIDPVSEWSRIQKIVANKAIAPSWRDEKGYSAAFYQLLYGSHQRAGHFIAQAPRKGKWIEGSNTSLLVLAIYEHSPQVVAALVKHGEPMVELNGEDIAPIQLAARMGQFEIVRILLKAGVDGYCRKCLGYTPIALALREGNWKMVLLMHDLGIDAAEYKKQTDQGELIFRAIDGRQLNALVMLVQMKFDFNVENVAGMTPLAYALAKHSWGEGMMDFLLDRGDYCLRNAHGQRILEQVAGIEWLFEPGNEDWIKEIQRRTASCDRGATAIR